MRHKEIDINGQKVAYYESAGTRQPVLFIHGNSMSGLCFERQFNCPFGKQFRLIALDLPGHGRSSTAQGPKSGYNLPAYADIVCDFVNHLGIADTVLVGWSLGGHVLLEAIGRLHDSPGIMIFGTPPVGKPIAADAFIPHPLMPLLFSADLNGEEAALTAAFFKPDCQIPSFFCEDMMRTDGRAREALWLSLEEGNYADEVKVVTGLNKPLAVVHSEKESIVNLSYIRELAIPTLWRNEIQIVHDAGHALQWEQPGVFNAMLMKFIEEL